MVFVESDTQIDKHPTREIAVPLSAEKQFSRLPMQQRVDVARASRDLDWMGAGKVVGVRKKKG